MKMRKIVIACCATAIMALMTACGSQKQKESAGADISDIKFEAYTYDIITQIQDSLLTEPTDSAELYVRYVGQGVLPEVSDSESVLHLRDSLLHLVGLQRDEDGKLLPEIEKDEKLTDLVASETESCGYVYSTLAATLVTPRIVVWESFRNYYSCGTVHGNTTTTYINYSLSDHKILEADDVFKPGYEPVLRKLLRDKIKAENVALLMPLNEVDIPQEFELMSSGILFSYNPYDIAPYSEGTIKIKIDLDSLRRILTPLALRVMTGISE